MFASMSTVCNTRRSRVLEVRMLENSFWTFQLNDKAIRVRYRELNVKKLMGRRRGI
jgi:hypothetical protein